ncbi:MAG: hypothetical protein HY556_01350 [Euryarchaeota archaeon]|nr:hypothetical protein [Euryarchaeota archaeon]
MEGFRLDRATGPGIHPLTRLATGLGGSTALREKCGGARQAEDFVATVEAVVTTDEGFMKIDVGRGAIEISGPYLSTGDERHIYLDLIHELIHIQQHRRGLELWDRRYSYVDRPTEIEAYKAAVLEARSLGFTEIEIAQYLEVPWVSPIDHRRLLETLGVRS